MSVSAHSSWHKTPESLVNSSVIIATRSIFFSNEVSLGGLLMEAGHQKDQLMIKKLRNFNSISPSFIEITGAYVSKCLQNPQSMRRFPELPGGWTQPQTWRVTHPNCTGTEGPTLGTLPDLIQHILPSGCLSASFITSFIYLFISYLFWEAGRGRKRQRVRENPKLHTVSAETDNRARS